MKFAMAMLELSGDVAYANHIEQSYYNAYAGAFNTRRVARIESSKEGIPQVLPFDSYSPLVSDTRGRKVGGYNIFPDKTYYGCCACIGAAGAGVIPQIALMRSEKGLVFNFYEQGKFEAMTPTGKPLAVQMDTAYPYNGAVKLTLTAEAPEAFELTLRVPAWCDGATVTAKGKSQSAPAGYVTLSEEWSNGDEILLDLPMAVKRVLPPEGAVNADVFAAYTYGPLVLAADKRITDPDAVLDVAVDQKGIAASREVYCPEIRETHICLEVALTDGTKVRLIDYASAGKTWTEESRCAAWLYRRPLA
jgi:DUF1680 family protein